MNQTADQTAAPANVKQYLDVSTSHVTEAECKDIKGGPVVVAVEHGYGWWIHVPSEEDMAEQVADLTGDVDYTALIALLDRARELGCSWINLDADAEQLDGLPTFDW
jgi:hypothetical protein